MRHYLKKILSTHTAFLITLISPFFFFVVLTALSFLWQPYNSITTGMSEIGAVDSPFRHYMNFLGFAPLGISILFFGFGIQKILPKSTQKNISVVLIFLSGFFLFLVSFLPCDANCVDTTVIGKTHSLVSTVPAILLPISAMLLANILYKRINKLLGYISFWFGFASFLSGPLMFIPILSGYSGAIQKIGIGCSLAWIVALSAAFVTKLPKKSAK